VKDLPQAEIISAQASYCKGKEYGLLLSTQVISGATYDWYKDGIKQNNTGNEIDSALAGNWKVKVTLNACQDSSLLKKIEEKPVPVPVLIASGLAYCAGTNNINLAAKDTSSSIVYQWLNNGAIQGSNKFINNANAGNWTLVASLNGCADTSAITTITEKSLPDAFITTPSDSLFYYTNHKGITLKAKDAGTGATYTWFKNGSFYSTTTVDSITDVKEGNWSLSVSKNGCSNSTPIDASVVELNLNPIALNDTLITNYLTNISWKITQNDYDPDGIIINKEVDLAVKQIGLQQTIIKKDTGIVFVDQGGFLTFVPDQNFTGTTVFEYTVKDNNGNESNIAHIVISVGPHIFDDYQVITTNTTGTIAILANDISKNGFDISNIDLDPSQAGVQSTIYKSGVGVYTVLPDGTVQIIPDENIEAVDSIYYQVSDLKGAYSNIAKIKVKIRSIGVIIPDGFSPNGDDNHDVLAIYNPAGHIINVEIYNRWGNLVYEKTNYKDEFSGKANAGGIIIGGELPDGTYFATFDIQRIDGSKEKLVKSILIKR
jgi:gliding motility-associated-like protein